VEGIVERKKQIQKMKTKKQWLNLEKKWRKIKIKIQSKQWPKKKMIQNWKTK